jgi:hypothetical protein
LNTTLTGPLVPQVLVQVQVQVLLVWQAMPNPVIQCCRLQLSARAAAARAAARAAAVRPIVAVSSPHCRASWTAEIAVLLLLSRRSRHPRLLRHASSATVYAAAAALASARFSYR